MGLKEDEAAKVNAIGDKIRELKKQKAAKEVVLAEVEKLKAQKAAYEQAVGEPFPAPAPAPAPKKKAPAPAPAPAKKKEKKAPAPANKAGPGGPHKETFTVVRHARTHTHTLPSWLPYRPNESLSPLGARRGREQASGSQQGWSRRASQGDLHCGAAHSHTHTSYSLPTHSPVHTSLLLGAP